ncbi:MAG: two-component system, cell cycle sensor histidine kinase and response regulator CckA [Pyrinomonadaceae bacterium]|nr:two-component system, cell cycle sensor histidine kinase and response regulator CckA [Pyrinomonadaceae bacterium]
MSNQAQNSEQTEIVSEEPVSKTALGRILVVDDEPQLRAILQESLQRYGFEATSCGSGSEALAKLRERDFDLLLTDLMMPEMDGVTLLKAALEVDPHLSAIILTGQGTIQTAVDAMQVGAFDYVLKPFRLQNLLPVLTRALNARQLRLENLQLQETVAIHELVQTIAFTLDPHTVMSKLTEAALQQTEADEVSVLLPTSDGREFYVAAARGGRQERLLGERIPFDRSIASWVARERTPVILNGEVKDDRFVALWPRPAIRSSVSVPMVVANKLVGVLNLNMLQRQRPFALGQMKALTILAGTAAAALESASLYTQLRQAEEKYRSIFENAIEGVFQSTPDGKFITVNPATAQILGYESPAEVIETITDIGQQLYVDPVARTKSDELQEERGVLHGFEFEAYRKDGEKIWLSVNRRSFRDDAGTELYREGSIEDITERKRADAVQERLNDEIRQQKERLNTIVGTVPGVVFEARGNPNGPDHHSEFVSEYVTQMLGYSIAEWLETPGFWLTIVHPDDRERVVREAAGHFLACRKGDLEFRWIRKDERFLWVRAHTMTICDSEGKPVGMRGVVTDITKRVEAQQALSETVRSKEEALALLDTLVSSAPIGIAFHNLDFTYRRINPSLAAINGLPAEAHLGKTLREMLPEMADTLEPLLQRVIDTGEPILDLELTGGPRTNAPLENYWLVSFYPIRLHEGELLGVGVLVSDITNRKQGEKALRESEERYRELVENAHDIIYEHDLQGNYTSTNKAGEEITGYSRLDTLKLNFTQTVSPEYVDKGREMLRRKLAGEEITAYELEIITKAGKRIPVEVNSRLVYQNGVPVGVQGIARDVSERKLLEEQLRQAQRLEAIGQLAGGVAHDFNNLLTVIGGYSSILLSKLPSESPHRASVEEIKKAGDRAGALTRQLLAFSRKQILQPKILNLNTVVTDLEKMVRRLIGEDIDVLSITAPALGQVKADPGQLEQVLLNLIVNARDAMPHGGKLTIETRNVFLSDDYAQRHAAQPGSYVMLAVSDTGEGMDAATQPRIFDPFFTTKPSGQGTGLGLATVYGIVKQSGGNIWVYSEVGRGSTFKIYLPRVDQAPESETDQALKQPPHGTELVLLVEDEDQVRTILQHILEEQGYRVLAAANGAEALLLAQDRSLDIRLMITDVVMPQMGGRELAESVTALRPNLPVLFMSGYTDDAIVRHGLLDEKINFIQKPFDSTTVALKVRGLLDAEVAPVI